MLTRKALMTFVAATTILAAGVPAGAVGGYYINGHQANYYEALQLRSYGYPPGWYRVGRNGGIGQAEPGYNRVGPGGSSMSNGRCAFIEGVPVGNCNN